MANKKPTLANIDIETSTTNSNKNVIECFNLEQGTDNCLKKGRKIAD